MSYLSTYEDFIAQPSMAYDGILADLRNATTASTNLRSTMSHSLIPVRMFRYSNSDTVLLSGEKPPSLAVTEPVKDNTHQAVCRL